MLLESRNFDAGGSAVGGETATMGEVFDATLESMRLTENANSRLVALERAYDARIDAVARATGVKLFNPVRDAVAGPGTMAGFEIDPPLDPQAEFQKRLEELATGFPQFRGQIAAERPVIQDAFRLAQEAEGRFDSTWNRSNGVLAPWAARIAGGFAGSFYDPTNVALLALGPWGEAGAGVRGLAWMALKSGAVNAAGEAAIQPAVQAWRAEAGLPHGLDQAALNVGFAALFGAGVDAGARSAVRGVRRLAGRPYLGPVDALDDAARQAPDGSLLRRAANEDAGALRELAAATGVADDPTVRAALDVLESPTEFNPARVDDGENLRQLSQGIRRGVAGGTELPPGEAISTFPAPARPDMADSATARLGATETLEGRPVAFVAIDPQKVTTDATTFQFKSEGDAAGVTARLAGVKRWDPLSAGKAFVFERLDGELVIADGHQRLGLAKRLADQNPQLHAYVFREADGWTPGDVRAHAAMKNMREQSGASIDMAKVMRERPDLVDDSLPLSDGKMREAAMLAKLAPEAFDAVVAGRLPATFAALIGDHVTDGSRHIGLLNELAAADLANASQARFFLAELMALPTTTETQITLFGEEAVTRTVRVERAKVLDASLRELKTNQRIFGLLDREQRRIAESGNVLDREGNAARAQNAAELAELIEKLSTTRGIVATLLNDAATAVARGYAPGLAAKAFTRRIGDLLDAEGINGLLKAADEPPAGGRLDDPAGAEAKAQVEALERDADQGVMFAIGRGDDDAGGGAPDAPASRDAPAGDAPRTNADGFVLMLPFREKWGDPRFNAADKARALARIEEMAALDPQKAPLAQLAEARNDLREISGQLLFYRPDVDFATATRVLDEVWSYAFDRLNGGAENVRPSIFNAPDPNLAIAEIVQAGRAVLDRWWEARAVRMDLDALIEWGRYREPPPPRASRNDPARIAEARGGFFFNAARKLADVPDALFRQGGRAVINALEQAGVKRAEIEHFGLDELASSKPVTRAEVEQRIADRIFEFRRKTSWLNPEVSQKDYELGGTRAFRGPRIPGRGIYFERLMAFPKKLKSGEAFAPGHFQSPHWEDILAGAWASWRGSVREVEGWGKLLVGEEGQSDFMQGAMGRGDDWTGRRPRVKQKDFLELRGKGRAAFEQTMQRVGGIAQDAMNFIDQGQVWGTRQILTNNSDDNTPEIWQKVFDNLRREVAEREVEPAQRPRQQEILRSLDEMHGLRQEKPEFFETDARRKFDLTERSFTPETPLDESYVRTMVRDLLLAAAKEKASAIAIATSETTNRIQINTKASAAHFYDGQLKPALERELRRLTGDGSITLEKIALPKPMGGKKEKPYTVWAARLPAELAGKINREGLPMLSARPSLANAVPSARAAAEMATIRADIDKAMSKMLPLDWRHEARDALVYGGRQVEGYADPYERIVYVSLAALDPLERAFEEAGHALRAAKLIPAADYEILRAEARRLGAREHFDIDARYGEPYGQRWKGNPGKLADALEEEAVFQMAAAHARGKTFGEPTSAARRVLDRIVKFLRAVGEALKGRGLRSYDDVFQDMVSGRMARPEAHPEVEAARRAVAMRGVMFADPGPPAGGGGGGNRRPGSIPDLINGAAAEGRINREEAAALLGRLDMLETHYRDNPAQAANHLADEVDAEVLRRQRLALLTDEARQRVRHFVHNFRDARGQPDPAKAAIALLEHHGQTPMPDGASSVVGRRQAILGLSMAVMEEALHEFRRTWVTGRTRSRARLDNVVREAFGEGTGDQAAGGFARAWGELAEELRQRFNAAGGQIGRLENWGLPQHHDRRAMLNSGMQTWIEYITPRLDLARMRSPLTGAPMTAADLRASLEWIWRNITADGWVEREPSMVRFGIGIVANQRADHRFLHFRNADAWLEYQAEFGGGADPFAAMMNHIRGMAEDIAAMEILGPNPRGMLTELQQFVLRQGAFRASGQPALFPAVTEITGRRMAAAGNWLTTKGAESYAREAVKLTDDMWDIYRGAAGAVVNQRIADVFGTIRSLNIASKLGGAAVSAMTDLGYAKVSRYFARLPLTSTWGDMLRAFSTNKRDAVRGGLILDSAAQILHQEARWAGAMQGPEWAQYLADRVVASTGLAAWTQAGKHAFGLSIQAELASRAGETFGDLPAGLQRLFRRYGLTPADWEAIRAEGAGDPDFLTPQMVQASGVQNLAERYLEMILQETEYAVPAGGLKVQAMVYGGLRRGVLVDEMRRSMAQFKMFGLSVAMLQTQRIANEIIANGGWRGAGYAAGLLITTTLYGALVIQLKELAKGRDPREMGTPFSNPQFWGQAVLQSGGLGIYGDFLSAETNRMGGGLARTLVGPTADVAAGVLALGPGNVAQWVRGEKTNTGREVVRFLAQNTPGGSNWYLRLAYERVLLDNLQRLADPEAHAAFRRKVQMQKRDYRNEFFWAPGESAPRRAPDLGAALGR